MSEARPTVLVVEDEPEIRHFLHTSLAAEGYRVAESASGRRRKYYTLQRPGRQALMEQKDQWLIVHETLIAALGAGGVERRVAGLVY